MELFGGFRKYIEGKKLERRLWREALADNRPFGAVTAYGATVGFDDSAGSPLAEERELVEKRAQERRLADERSRS